MSCAIITGASSGLGVEFALRIKDVFPETDELWLIARRGDKLDELAARLSGINVRCLGIDLTDNAGLDELDRQLKERSPSFSLLINSAGCGYLGNFHESAIEQQLRMTALNIHALTAVTRIVLDYMPGGGRIINLSSIASFVPNARMTVYSATKSYVSSFSRGLHEELRSRNISVTAVCPGPMATEFLDTGGIKGNSKTFETLPYCDPASVAEKSLLASRARRAVYTPRSLYKVYRVLSGIVPHALLVKIAKT